VHFCENVSQDIAGTVLASHITQGNITKMAETIVKTENLDAVSKTAKNSS